MEAARARNTRMANARTATVARNRAAIGRERSLVRANTTRVNRNEAVRTRSARIAATILR
jgi:hypothetical protein